ncbi:hypothetical protein N9A67_06135 [Rhodobacteraceae bacterium]|nr:hypothetical protein [Paracoccaceae bacterium]
MSINSPKTARPVTSETLRLALGIKSEGKNFTGVGDIHSKHSNNLLSFIKDDQYINQVNANNSISGIFCKTSTATKLRPDIQTLVVEDPNWSFFTLIDYLSKTRIFEESSFESCLGTALVSVASVGVYIGRNVRLEDFAIVKPGTIIHDRVLIRSGAVLGLDTFQHQYTSLGMVSPAHDGDLIVDEDVEIGAQCTISKGFSYRSTKIGRSSKLDAGVYVGHGAEIGSETIICTGAKIMGHCKIEDGAFIGPGAIVSSRITVGRNARVSLGAVVTRDVPPGETVSGNFAIPHGEFIAKLKRGSQGDN